MQRKERVCDSELSMFYLIMFNTDSQAIAELIDRQRLDQETMFRAFTNGIPIFLAVSVTGAGG